MNYQDRPEQRTRNFSASRQALLNKWKSGVSNNRSKKQELRPRIESGPAPLSFQQLQLWFLDNLFPNNLAYTLFTALQIDGPLQIHAMKQSFQEIIRRHEALRITFSLDAGEPVQTAHPELSLSLPLIDLSHLTTQEREAQIERTCRQETQTPFNLSTGPLLRTTLLRLTEQKHFLLLAIHHIIFDGWSLEIFLREFALIYEAIVTGTTASLPDLPIQYSDYASWQRKHFQGPTLEKQVNFWVQQLKNAPTLSTLPTDYPRPASKSFNGAQLSFTIPLPLVSALKTLGQQHNATLFMTLSTALQILLFRYSQQSDILLGTTLANRTPVETEPLIGFFANTLVLRAWLADHLSFLECLEQTRTKLLETYLYQDTPFEKIVEALQPKREMGYTPLFQIMFVLQNAARKDFSLPGLVVKQFNIDPGTSKFDLWIGVTEEEDGISGLLEYSTDLFEASTIQRLIRHYLQLLDTICKTPRIPIGTLPLLTEIEQQQITVEWNATTVPYNLLTCLHHLFEEQVQRTPHAIAAIFENQHLTYQELNRRANQLARFLHKKGVRPDTAVGICMERSLELVVGLLGILKAGGAYVPLDPAYPAERKTFILQDATIQLLLTQHRLQTDLSHLPAEVICLDSDWEQIREEASTNPMYHMTSAHLAYIIYTSGSTGKPKGVMIPHAGIVNRLLWMQETYQLTEEDRVLQKTPFTFDVSVWEFFWTVITGACLVIAQPNEHRSGAYLVDIIQRQAISTIHFVPSMLDIFINTPNIIKCSTLQRVFCSGEALTTQLQNTFFTHLNTKLYNLYGPTEASIDVTFWKCSPTHPQTAVPIGHPIANTQIYLLDKRLNPVPIGVAGELHIGGVGLARGYLHRPDLTAEHFIPHPFSDEPGARLYKTGDMAFYRKDSSIVFLGRQDHQVKLHGLRIELGEIEMAIERHASIQKSIVTVKEDNNAGKRLVGYVIPHPFPPELEQTLQSDTSFWTISPAYWAELFRATYSPPSNHQLTRNNMFRYVNSYSGLPLSVAEIQEWIQGMVDQILEFAPQSILEIGCGTELLFPYLASHSSQYHILHSDQGVVEFLQESTENTLLASERVVFTYGLPGDIPETLYQRFDAVILHSVVPYIPDAGYLLHVLREAIKALRPGGHIFLGSICNLSWLKAFYTSIELHQATSSSSTAYLKQRIEQYYEQEKDLAVDPTFFFHLQQQLPEIAQVIVRLKRGGNHELTRFRYDVILTIDLQAPAKPEIQWFDWEQDQLNLNTLHHLLQTFNGNVLAIRHIPNSRVSLELNAFHILQSNDCPEMVKDLQNMLSQFPPSLFIDPEDLWELGEECNYVVDIQWAPSHSPASYIALFQRRKFSSLHHSMLVAAAVENTLRTDVSMRTYTNAPWWRKQSHQLVHSVRRHLQDILPDYMVPSVILPLRMLPLTANGKIDRRALPAPEQSSLEITENYTAPRTLTETLLAEIWSQVLGLERVGISSNFFEIGGDSIRSIQVVSRAREAGLQMAPKLLFQYQTIAALAKALEDAAPRRTFTEAPEEGPIQSTDSHTIRQIPPFALATLDRQELRKLLEEQPDIEDVYPLSPMQQHMLFQRLHSPQSGLYVIHQIFPIEGLTLNIQAFEAAWQQVIDQHPILRTTFAWQNLRHPHQLVHRRAPVVLHYHDWSTLPPEQQDRCLERYVDTMRQENFPLNTTPQMNVSLFKYGEENYRFLWAFNYMLQDGWSFPLFMEDFFTSYTALCQGKRAQISSPRPFKDYIDWVLQQDQAQAERFWKHTLPKDSRVSFFLPRQQFQRYLSDPLSNYKKAQTKIPVATVAALRTFAQQHQLTLNTLMQGAWALLLSGISGEQDVIFGAVVSGRSGAIADIEHMVGLFNSLLPVYIHISPASSLIEWLRDIQEKQAELRQYEYSFIPTREPVPGTGQRYPLFDSYLVFENFPVSGAFIDHLRGWNSFSITALARTEHLLRIEFAPGAALAFNISYSPAYLPAEMVVQIQQSFLLLLEEFVIHPQSRLSYLQALIERNHSRSEKREKGE